MPRKARIDVPGALQHLIIRGIERKRIFRDDQDRDDFLNRLGKILAETRTPCYAWVLMANHVHLLLKMGKVPLAVVMRRLLTGYALTYNRRHGRHGQLFQNRYKSFLCQEDAYFLELVRYIHLNPLRAKLVSDLRGLDKYQYSGHGVVLGYQKNGWQDVGSVLGYFGRKVGIARRKYRGYVGEGIARGKRPELVGGGLIRSMGGWEEVKGKRKEQVRMKGDERILGESDFVMDVLRAAEEEMERRYRLKARGYDLDKLGERVAGILGLKKGEVWAPGKYARVVEGRSLFCYWAVRELGVSASDLARRMKLSQPAVSMAVQRGERIAQERGLQLFAE